MNLAIEILNDKEKCIRWIIGIFGISRASADDYLSEGILKLLERKKIDSIKYSKSYFYILIRNLIIDSHIRKREPDIIYSDDLGDYDRNELQNRNGDYTYKGIRDEIYKLKASHKECLILRFRFELTHEEIAKHFNLSRCTITQKIMRAQAKLRYELLN